MKHKAKTVYGFTLIELLVVISIIALLVAIMLPGLANARASVKRLLCGIQLKNVGYAIGMYISDYDKYPAQMNETVLFAGKGYEYVPGSDKFYTYPYQLCKGKYFDDAENYKDATGSYRWIKHFRCTETCWAPTSESAYGVNPAYNNPHYAYGHTDYIYLAFETAHRGKDFWAAVTVKQADSQHLLFVDSYFIGPNSTRFERMNHKGKGANSMYGDYHVEWWTADSLPVESFGNFRHAVGTNLLPGNNKVPDYK